LHAGGGRPAATHATRATSAGAWTHIKSKSKSSPVKSSPSQVQVKSKSSRTWVPMLPPAQIRLSPQSLQSAAVVRSKHTQDPQIDGCTLRATLSAACEQYEEGGPCRRRLTLQLVSAGPWGAWYLPSCIVTSVVLHGMLGWRADGGAPSSTALHLFCRDALPHQVKSSQVKSSQVKSSQVKFEVEVEVASRKSKSIQVQSNRIQSSSPVTWESSQILTPLVLPEREMLASRFDFL